MPTRREPLPSVEDQTGPRCPWDDQPVSIEGATCDPTCYLLQVEHLRSLETVLVRDGESLVRLTDGEKLPLDITEQPWYLEVIGFKEEA